MYIRLKSIEKINRALEQACGGPAPVRIALPLQKGPLSCLIPSEDRPQGPGDNPRPSTMSQASRAAQYRPQRPRGRHKTVHTTPKSGPRSSTGSPTPPKTPHIDPKSCPRPPTDPCRAAQDRPHTVRFQILSRAGSRCRVCARFF